MSTGEILWRLGAAILLILANASFVVVEFALTRLRQHSRDQISGHERLERAWEMTEELEIYLTGCQLGISLSSIVLGIVAEPAMTAVLDPLFAWIGITGATKHTIAIVLGVVIINLAHKIWGEQTPTYLGVERPLEVAKIMAPVLYWWTKLTYPLIIFGDSAAKWTLRLFGVEMTRSWAQEEADGDSEDPVEAVSGRAELREQMIELLGHGEIEGERRDEIVNALEMGETPVRAVMIPRDKVAYLSTRHTTRENLDIIARTAKVRYPLVGHSPDDVLGIVYTPGLLKAYAKLPGGEIDFESIASDALRVPAQMTLDALIDELQLAKEEAALVEDPDGAVIGFVTATDAFEAIVGSLEDPFD